MVFAALLSGSAAPFTAQASPSPLPSAAPKPAATPHGLSIFGRYVGEYATNLNGGYQLGSAYASEFQFGANYAFAQRVPGDSGTLHLILTERWGSGLTPNAIHNVGSVQEIFGDGLTPRLTELDYEQVTDNGKFDVHAGRVIMQNDFAASSTYWGGNLWCRYQTNSICGTPLAAPNNSGYGYYPSSEWGAYFKVSPNKGFYAQTGAFQVNPVYANRGQGFNLGLYGTTGVDFPLEIGFLSYDTAGNYTGSVRVGGYFDTSSALGSQSNLSKFVAPANPALALVPTTLYRGRSGGWLLFDHLLRGTSAPNGRGTAFFAAYEYGDANTAFISNFADAGIVVHGTFPKRDNDTIALGYYYLQMNPNLQSFERSLQTQNYAVPTTAVEQELELNYGIAATPQILIRPSLQYVINPAGETGGYAYPGGAVGLHNAVVLGFNATYSY